MITSCAEESLKKARLTEDNQIIVTFNKISKSEFEKIYKDISGLPKEYRKYISSSKEWGIDVNTPGIYDLLRRLNFDIDPQIYCKLSNAVIDEGWKSVEIPKGYEFLYPDQIDCFKFALGNGAKVLWASAMGAGKTASACCVSNYLNYYPILIVSPSVIRENWKRQYQKWINEEDSIKIINSSEDMVDYKDEHDVIIVNYQLLARHMKRIKTDGKDIYIPTNQMIAFTNNCFQSIILDEVHAIKTHTSQTSKAIKYLAKDVDVILALSGTPLSNRNLDLFPILNILRPEEFDNFQRFAKRYCQTKIAYLGKKRVESYYGSRNSEELNNVLSNGIMLRQKVEDIKGMRGQEYIPPNIQVISINVKKSKKYTEAENKLGSGINSGKDKKTNLGNLSKLRVQAWEEKKKVCLEFIDDVLEECEYKIVVYVHNKVLMEDLKKHYKEKLLYIDGSVDASGTVRDDVIQEFGTNDNVRIIALSIQSGNSGIDGLQQYADTMIFLQECWNESTKQQCYGRLSNRTGGLGLATNIYHLVLQDSIEELFLKLQDKKLKMMTEVVDGEEYEEEESMMKLLEYYKNKFKNCKIFGKQD